MMTGARWKRLQAQLESFWHKARVSRWTKVGVTVLTLGFIVGLLIYNQQELKQFGDWRIYLSRCLGGFLLYPISLGLQAVTWGLIMARLSGGHWSWKDIEIYTYTHLMKHLPGGVWYLAGRVAGYQEEGVNVSVTLAASALEWLLLLVAAVTLYGALSLSGISWLWGLAVFGVCLSTTVGFVRWLRSPQRRAGHIPKFARCWVAGLAEVQLPTVADFALWLSGYLLAYIIGGLILYLLLREGPAYEVLSWVEVVRIWALTGGIGFLLSMVVPSGLIARELTLTVLLAPFISAMSALLIAVLLRFLFVVGDLLWGGLFWLVARWFVRMQHKGRYPFFILL